MIENLTYPVLDRQEVVFMLRRIENDIDKEQNLFQLVQLIRGQRLTSQDILSIIEKDMIKKDEVLQIILLALNQQGITDFITRV